MWVLTLAAMTTGLSTFSILFGQAGEPLLAAIALGYFLMGGFSFLVATLLQVGPSGFGEPSREILCGRRRTTTNAGGIETLPFQVHRTPVDPSGHCLEIYGSGGWVFESPRARHRKPCGSRGFTCPVFVEGFEQGDLGSHSPDRTSLGDHPGN